jgi:hypothetical protein
MRLNEMGCLLERNLSAIRVPLRQEELRLGMADIDRQMGYLDQFVQPEALGDHLSGLVESIPLVQQVAQTAIQVARSKESSSSLLFQAGKNLLVKLVGLEEAPHYLVDVRQFVHDKELTQYKIALAGHSPGFAVRLFRLVKVSSYIVSKAQHVEHIGPRQERRRPVACRRPFQGAAGKLDRLIGILLPQAGACNPQGCDLLGQCFVLCKTRGGRCAVVSPGRTLRMVNQLFDAVHCARLQA